jgi:hypothetical protein
MLESLINNPTSHVHLTDDTEPRYYFDHSHLIPDNENISYHPDVLRAVLSEQANADTLVDAYERTARARQESEAAQWLTEWQASQAATPRPFPAPDPTLSTPTPPDKL